MERFNLTMCWSLLRLLRVFLKNEDTFLNRKITNKRLLLGVRDCARECCIRAPDIIVLLSLLTSLNVWISIFWFFFINIYYNFTCKICIKSAKFSGVFHSFSGRSLRPTSWKSWRRPLTRRTTPTCMRVRCSPWRRSFQRTESRWAFAAITVSVPHNYFATHSIINKQPNGTRVNVLMVIFSFK